MRVAFRSIAIVFLIWLVVLELWLYRLRGAAAAVVIGRCSRRILRLAGVTLCVEGQKRGAGLMISNHRSYLDILAILSVHPCSFLCKREVESWPLVGGVAERLGVVFVDRSSRESRAATLARISALAVAGAELVAFPEGTTTRGPGMRTPYPGLFRAAESKGFSIVPVVIEYEDPDDAWVGDDTLLRHVLVWLAKPQSHVTLRFGSALHVTDADPGSLQARAEAWMRSSLHELDGRYVRARASIREGKPGPVLL